MTWYGSPKTNPLTQIIYFFSPFTPDLLFYKIKTSDYLSRILPKCTVPRWKTLGILSDLMRLPLPCLSHNPLTSKVWPQNEGILACNSDRAQSESVGAGLSLEEDTSKRQKNHTLEVHFLPLVYLTRSIPFQLLPIVRKCLLERKKSSNSWKQ